MKYIIPILATLFLFSACRKKINEKKYTGTYSGEWHITHDYYEYNEELDTMEKRMEKDTVVGTFLVVRTGNKIQFGESGYTTDLKKIRMGEEVSSAQNTPLLLGALWYWKTTFFEDSIHWENGEDSGGMYASRTVSHFYGTK